MTEAIQQYGTLHGDDLSRVPDKTLKAAVQEYYRRVGAKTAAGMTKEQRRERARNAAIAKWEKAEAEKNTDKK